MTLDFDSRRWDAVRQTYERWWNGTLDRPVVPVCVAGRDPGRPQPDAPLLSQATCAQLDIPADDVIDRIDHELSRRYFLGDAFPYVSMDGFGPGVLAAFLGAQLDNRTGLVWFRRASAPPIEELHVRFDPDNVWFRRIRDLYVAGMKRWQGQVLMGMTDLGGAVDVLSTLRPGEELLLDLINNPDEVKRLTWEIHEAWHQSFNALNEALHPWTPGYSDWTGIYSPEPRSVFQCDFAYMIGPEAFEEFVLPEIAASCAKVERSFYHLDGKGQLPHLDLLLGTDDLRGVQWVPGEGSPDCSHWPDVYRRIRAAGKRIQLIGNFDILGAVVSQLGDGRGIQLLGAGAETVDQARRELARFGIE